MTEFEQLFNRLVRIETMLERVIGGAPVASAPSYNGSYERRCAEALARREQLDKAKIRRSIEKQQRGAGNV